MILSNPAKLFLATALISTVCGGCGLFKNYIERAPATPSDVKRAIPFSNKEPDVFQAEFVTIGGGVSNVSFYAKKGENWRFDTAFGSDNSISLIKTDKMYSISHAIKVYAEAPGDQSSPIEPDFVNDLTWGLLREANNPKFEEAGRDGSVVKYNVSIGDNVGSRAVVYFDESVGMVVREEFLSLPLGPETGLQPEFTFEVRNLKMEVDDGLFMIPAGYRKVAWSGVSGPAKQKTWVGQK